MTICEFFVSFPGQEEKPTIHFEYKMCSGKKSMVWSREDKKTSDI